MDVISQAMGHIRAAAGALLEMDDASGQALLQGIAALDLQSLFDELEITPAHVPASLGPADSLRLAAGALQQDPDQVPLAVWSRLQELLRKVG